jgi:hemoglobin
MKMHWWAGVLVALIIASQVSAAAQAPAASSLYKRLGGYDAIAAVVDDFFARLVADPDLGTFFKAHSTDSNSRTRQLLVDQLCAATGGPCIYIGRPMKQSHAGLGITEAQWDKMVVHLKATLDKFKVGKTEQDELLAATSTLKPDIVDAKKM